MPRDFGSKNGQLPMASRMYSCEAKRKQKTPKDAKWNDLKKMAIWDFQTFWFLTPQNQNFDFFKNKYLQNQNF